MATSVYVRVGERLQALRKAHGLTQNALAEEAEIGVSYLVKVEAGDRKARLEILDRIAKAMGEPLWRLFADQRLTKDEQRWHGDVARLLELAEGLGPDDLRALLGVAQQLRGRK